MSKYLTFTDVQFTSEEMLVEALKDIGYGQIERGEKLSLYGYHGDKRPETAEIVIRRKYVGSLSNDIGFARTEKGLVPIVSEFDQQTVLGGQFITKLRVAYNERAVNKIAARLRGSIHRIQQGAVTKIRVRF